MADLREMVLGELDNISAAVVLLPHPDRLSTSSALELAGAAALLHSFYNGVESILKQVLLAQGHPLPTGESWHRDLVNAAHIGGIISEETKHSLAEYLAFRHFFAHAYAFDLNPDRIEPLVRNLPAVLARLRNELAPVTA